MRQKRHSSSDLGYGILVHQTGSKTKIIERVIIAETIYRDQRKYYLTQTSPIVAFPMTRAVIVAAAVVPGHHAKFNQQRQWILCTKRDHLFHDR